LGFSLVFIINLFWTVEGKIRSYLRERVQHCEEPAAVQEPAHSERADLPAAAAGRLQQGAVRDPPPGGDHGVHLPLPAGPGPGPIQRAHGHRAHCCRGGQGNQALPSEYTRCPQVTESILFFIYIFLFFFLLERIFISGRLLCLLQQCLREDNVQGPNLFTSDRLKDFKKIKVLTINN
jgi:hypothetical protein